MAEASPSSLAPLLAERYRVLRLVGIGGMGAVYEAEHVLIGRRVAVKVLRPELVRNAEMLRRFRTEAHAAGQLVSDHIVPVTDFGVAPDGTPFIVMELLEGESLSALLARKQRLRPSDAVDLVIQACRGVQRAHDAGVVHCDLKPRNLFLVTRDDGSRHVKVLDFGIAKITESPCDSGWVPAGQVLGTPSYMSPEQASGDEDVDVRSDVYALGVILYQLLSGSLPHPGVDPVAVRTRVARDSPIRLDSIRPELPERLVDIVHTALQRRPQDRFQSAQQLALALAVFHTSVARHGDEVPAGPGSGDTCPIDAQTLPSSIQPRSAAAETESPGGALDATTGATAAASSTLRCPSGHRLARVVAPIVVVVAALGVGFAWRLAPPRSPLHGASHQHDAMAATVADHPTQTQASVAAARAAGSVLHSMSPRAVRDAGHAPRLTPPEPHGSIRTPARARLPRVRLTHGAFQHAAVAAPIPRAAPAAASPEVAVGLPTPPVVQLDRTSPY
jgi:serine/threonine protein kinase